MKHFNITLPIAFFSLFLFPVGAYAIDNLQDLIYLSVGLFNNIIYVIFSFALLMFFWGLAKFIASAGNDKSIADGKRLMLWGVIALFVMASVWGIVAFLQDSFDITDPYF
ncbi:MAG: hypothetical protein Q8O71_02745 [bacterium]|nr:hypothetical protein [bacterium]